MRRRAILPVIAWLCLVCAAAAQSLSFPALTGRVVDEAGLLDAAARAMLTQSLAELEQKTTDQLVVVTLKSLQGTSIEDYGYQLGRYWGIGEKGKNTGAILIVAPKEHKVRIEVGYGLEGKLTDAQSRMIIETDVVPNFRRGDFNAGVVAATTSILKVLGGEGVGAHQAGLGSEEEADGEEHDLGQPPGPAGDQPRRGTDLVQHGIVWAPQPGPAPEAVW